MLQSIEATRELGIRNNRQNSDMDRAKRANQRRNAKHSKRVMKDAVSKELETMDAEMEKLKKRKEELTRMAKESAKPVFRRDTVPLRPNLYRQPSPTTDQTNEPGPSNLNMPFQRGASADYDLYRPFSGDNKRTLSSSTHRLEQLRSLHSSKSDVPSHLRSIPSAPRQRPRVSGSLACRNGIAGITTTPACRR